MPILPVVDLNVTSETGIPLMAPSRPARTTLLLPGVQFIINQNNRSGTVIIFMPSHRPRYAVM